ncbi:MAG TPA: hypothetical protein VFV50_18870 [Bdellovibrionales bacterium]|nr:hypothetical protein [Bdellovibrionales bacterium]
MILFKYRAHAASLLVLTSLSGASALERSRIEAVGFASETVLIYRELDPACECQKGKCVFEDEGGKAACEPLLFYSIDLKTDKTAKIASESAARAEAKGPPPKLEPFPLALDGEVLTASLGADCQREYEHFAGQKEAAVCEVFLSSDSRGTKTVAKIQFWPSPNYAFKVLGYFASPRKSRIAVVVQESRYHFEGEMRTHQKIFGADLKSRFKK